nr:reverse transcriptase domain-containing protein [Tanacetum cinerariifolium]
MKYKYKRVPIERRDERPQHPRIIYPPVLDINHFRHFLIRLTKNFIHVDDEPLWAADRVVAPTPGPPITIPKTANEFDIKGNHLTLIKGNQFDGRLKKDPHKHIHDFLDVCDMFKYRGTKNEVVRLMMFPQSLMGEAKTWLDELNEGTIRSGDELRTAFISHSNFDTDKIIAKMDAMTMKMDAQYKEIQSRSNHFTPDCNDDDTSTSREEEAKFMQTF